MSRLMLVLSAIVMMGAVGCSKCSKETAPEAEAPSAEMAPADSGAETSDPAVELAPAGDAAAPAAEGAEAAPEADPNTAN